MALWVRSRQKTSRDCTTIQLSQTAKSWEANLQRASVKMAISRQSVTSVIRTTGFLLWAKVQLDMMKNTQILNQRLKLLLLTPQHSWLTAKILMHNLSMDPTLRIESRSKFRATTRPSRSLSSSIFTERSKRTFELLISLVVSVLNQPLRLSSYTIVEKKW